MIIRKPNRLINEKSPYLLQHAYNPVDWYPWGVEAFFKAKAEDKPIFLSTGYSSCHWCHVMEHESFENPQIAEMLNAGFVPIKVDREERPDVDEIYITAVQLMTGHAGWPLSVFLTPDGLPFYGGTYYPPQAFADLLTRVNYVWHNHRDQIYRSAQEIQQNLAQLVATRHEEMRGERTPEIFRAYKAQLMAGYDPQYGGFGGAPKFPPSTALPPMLYLAVEASDDQLGLMALNTLAQMAHGGMYDHIGGGFHRYSTDEKWFLPHFEKMLYDNAQLAYAYAYGYALTGLDFYAEVAHGIIQWLLREMRLSEGGFASALDADSPEGEGYYYTWREHEIYEILGEQDAPLFCKVYEVLPEGNAHDEATGRPTGRNILHMTQPLEAHANELGIPLEQLKERLSAMRAKLLPARQSRTAPARDDKVLTDWNGLVIWALACASDALEAPEYYQRASECAEFLWNTMWNNQGILLHRYREGESAIPAYLTDYAYLGMGLMSLYEANPEPKWLECALQLADQMVERFHDGEFGGFFSTDRHHDLLIVPVKTYQDRAMPSGNGAAVQFLAQLSTVLIVDDPERSERYRELAEATLDSCWRLLERAPVVGDSLLYGYLLLDGETMVYPNLQMEVPAVDEPEQTGPIRVSLVPQPEGLVVVFEIDEGWHINAPEEQSGRIPTRVEITTDLPIQFGEPHWTPSTPYTASGETLYVYTESAAAIVPIASAEATGGMEGHVRVRVVYQPCTDTECQLPVERVFLLPVSLREE